MQAPNHIAPLAPYPRVLSATSIRDDRSPTATLEDGTHLKLEVLHLVGDLWVDRNTITELQRTNRRVPGQPDARRKPERFETRLKSGIVNLPCVREHRQAHRLISRLRAGQRKKQLGVA